jgi:predicted acetylornithine/succinylornithine family transaminase
MTTLPHPPPVASVGGPRHPLMPTYAPAPVTFVRGQGSELWDSEGRRYLDFLSGIAVTSLGHAHPEVADAVATQARTLVHVSNLFSTPGGPAVARTLDWLLGDGAPAGGQVFFANSGAEANECAIKLARRWAPGRPVIVCADGGFHGRTMGALAATGQPAKQAPFQPLPEGFAHVPYGDLDAVDRVLAERPVGAVLVEAIQGEAGVVVPPAGYLVALAERCRRAGALLMVDEVQTGLGRTGRWFAHHHDGIRPDVVTMAKALGNGFPVGACWARAEVAAAFAPGDHATTFGGQPLAAAAVAATLSVMRREDVPRRAQAAGARLSSALEQLPTVSAVRGAGLLLGVVLPTPAAAEAVTVALAAGLVVNAPRPDVIRLAPSLLVSDAEIDEAVAVLAAVLEQVVR